MKLLVVTQVVDETHPVLGFFHRWVEEFATNYQEVHVICLEAGRHSLPANVTVHSLGKEAGKGRLTYLWRFYALSWRLRHSYNHVFVHMNPLYVVLGGVFWRMLGKRVGLWYTHGTVTLTLRLATILSHAVFTASVESFKLATRKKIVTGHGIDPALFAPQPAVKTIDLITVGRISPIKRIEYLLEAVAAVRHTYPVTLTVIGTALDEKGKEYQATLEEKSRELGIDEAVFWHGNATQAELSVLLNQAKVFVTASQTGSLDKVVLEAMACGLPVISAANGTISLPLKEHQVSSIAECVEAIMQVIKSSNYQRKHSVTYVEKQHSLSSLITQLRQTYAE